MQKIGELWHKIPVFTKVFLEHKTLIKDIDGNEIALEAGHYYISGFYVDAMGLSKTLKGARQHIHDFVIPSIVLREFLR